MHVYFLLGKEEFLMDEFIYKAPYEEEGKRILEVNILPETYCSFNCIYCPIDRKEDRHQTDEIQDLGDVTKALDDWGAAWRKSGSRKSS